MNEGQIDEGFGGLGQALVVLGQAAVAARPGDRALDDPAPGQGHEAGVALRLADDLDVKVPRALDQVNKLALISLVGKQPAEAWEALGVGAAGFSEGMVCVLPATTPNRHQGARPRASSGEGLNFK